MGPVFMFEMKLHASVLKLVSDISFVLFLFDYNKYLIIKNKYMYVIFIDIK